MSHGRFELAHLGHVELLTPRPAESLTFFTEVLGLSVGGYEGGSVYLHGAGDYEMHSVKLTEAGARGVGHVAWRSASPAALERSVEALARAGAGLGWTEGDLCHGRAYRAMTPEGPPVEVYFETRWRDDQTDTPHPARRGCGVSRLDHLTLAAADVGRSRSFLEGGLGLRLSERIVRDGAEVEGRLTSNNKFCDIAVFHERGLTTEPYSLAFVVDTSEDVRRAAHVCIEHDAPIETGPRHPVHQTVFVQVREPGGNPLEICCPGARLVLAPDWRSIVTDQTAPPLPRWELRTVAS